MKCPECGAKLMGVSGYESPCYWCFQCGTVVDDDVSPTNRRIPWRAQSPVALNGIKELVHCKHIDLARLVHNTIQGLDISRESFTEYCSICGATKYGDTWTLPVLVQRFKKMLKE